MVSLQRSAVVVVLALVGVSAWVGASAPLASAAKKPLVRPDALECFDRLSPEARLQLLDKIAKADQEFQRAVRGDVVVTIVARGSLESTKSNDIYCEVKSGTKGSPVATTIKWLVDNGTQVKKGDVLILLDDSHLQNKLKDQERTLAAQARAQIALQLAQITGLKELRLREIDVRLAELDLEKYAGADAAEKEDLQRKVARARVLVELTREIAEERNLQAEAELRSQTAFVEQQQTCSAEIEEQIQKCRLLAPVDGLVVYYVPEHVRGGAGAQQPIVAQGEPVREGQKLLQIPDLAKMLVQIRVPDALVSHLHNPNSGQKSSWQLAQIKVDAFPNRVLKGHVQFVDTVADSGGFGNWKKTYKTRIAIDESLNGLKPGMSTEVQIEVARKTGAVRVPIQSVVGADKAYYCYVKVGQAIQKRQVMTGLRNDLVVEIQEGLEEGEAVLLDPHGLLQRLSPFLGRP